MYRNLWEEMVIKVNSLHICFMPRIAKKFSFILPFLLLIIFSVSVYEIENEEKKKGFLSEKILKSIFFLYVLYHRKCFSNPINYRYIYENYKSRNESHLENCSICIVEMITNKNNQFETYLVLVRS